MQQLANAMRELSRNYRDSEVSVWSESKNKSNSQEWPCREGRALFRGISASGWVYKGLYAGLGGFRVPFADANVSRRPP